MKRTIPNKVQPVDDAREIDNEFAVEPSKQVTSGTSRARTSAAMIGLAISTMGASSLLLPRGGDSVVAAEPPVAAEPTAAMQPAPINGGNSSLNVADEATTPAIALPNLVVVKAQKGQMLWQGAREHEVDIAAVANATSIKPDTALQTGQLFKIPSVESLGSEVKGGHHVATLPDQKRYVESELTMRQTQLAPLAQPASVPLTIGESLPSDVVTGMNRLKQQDNFATNRRVELGSEESAKLSPVSPEAGRGARDEVGTSADPAALPVVPSDRFDSMNRGLEARSISPVVIESTNPQETPNVPGTGVIEPNAAALTVYSVKAGDTLDAIAKAHNVTVAQLLEVNEISNPHYLNVNQPINIPQPGSNSRPDAGTVMSDSAPAVVVPAIEAMLPLNEDASNSTPIVPTASAVEGAGHSSVLATTKFDNLQLAPFAARGGNSSVTFASGSAVNAGVGQEHQIANSETVSVQFISHRNTSAKVISEPTSLVAGVDNQSQAVKPIAGSNPYAERLRAEIIRLREEYRTERNAGNGTVAVQPQPGSKEASASEVAQPINPEFNPNRYTRAVQNEISQPQARQWAEQMQRQRQENSSVSNPVASVQTPPTATVQQPLVATAPFGADAYDPLSNPSLGQMVSPELPPLPSADTYLPNGSMRANGMIWPAKGVLTSGFGWRWGRMHKGIDIAGPVGTPIVAADSGVVTFAGWNDGGYGYLVEITHANGSQTLYAHNSRLLVQEGQKVSQGQQISEMGSTGFSTGPHLHFEIHPNGQGAVNPMAFLPSDESTAYR